MTAADSSYLLPNASDAAAERFAAFTELFDPSTFAHMDQIGVAPGWRCWEVGAGGTSVVEWLAARVGAKGHVLATDIDVSWTNPAADSGVEVRRHDVARDDPPGEAFDLVHARLVLVHITDRDAALRAMVRCLAPGGWLLVEDADSALQPLSCLDPRSSEEELANKIRTGFRALMTERGVDLAYGRKLPGLLREVGLLDVAADAYFPVALPACAVLEATTIAVIRDQLVDHGVATSEEIEAHLSAVAGGRLDLAQPPMISAWGRVPGG
jgi:SAM-dependent methyltransferase